MVGRPEQVLLAELTKQYRLSVYRHSVSVFFIGDIQRPLRWTNPAVATKTKPMPMTLVRSPTRSVIHPNAVMPAIAAVIAPVP